MKYIVFIGAEPFKKDLSKWRPFVGTEDYKKLLLWIADMDVDIADVILLNIEHLHNPIGVDHFIQSFNVDLPSISLTVRSNDIFIAMGKDAAQHLKKLDLGYFEFPHPSETTLDIKKIKRKCSQYIKKLLKE